MSELGQGFDFVGRQYHVDLGEQDFYIDLLFCHLKLRCYVVFDLKLGAFISRDKVHLVAMTGPCFRGDGETVLAPTDEGRFETVTCTYCEQLNGYRWLKSLDMGCDRRKPAHRLASPGTGHQGH